MDMGVTETVTHGPQRRGLGDRARPGRILADRVCEVSELAVERLETGQQLVSRQDAVQVVLPSDARKVHAFFLHSNAFTGSRCPDCGRLAIVVARLAWGR